MNDWLDITLRLKNGLPHWPGDMPYSRTVTSAIGVDGADCEVSVLSMSAHSGTHVDAPRHFTAGAVGISELDAGLFIGEAYVLDLTGVAGHVTVEDLAGRLPAGVMRLLVKVGNAGNGAFHEDFRAFTQGAAAYLRSVGVRLLGIDAPSIAPYDAPAGAHRAFLGEGCAALEGIDLRPAHEGWHDLICLPMNVAGGDGAPARALIRKKEARQDEA